MAREAIARRRLPDVARRLGDERMEALRSAGAAVLWTRVLVGVIAVVAAGVLGADAGNAFNFDQPALTHPAGGLGDALLAPLARWDAVWYLDIAHSGYGGPSTAFFPLYPLVVRALSPGGSPALLLVMSYVVSLAALGGALYLMHRLVALELGERVARPAVLLLALFPGALWLGAPYSESLFLLLSIGAFYAARTDRWAWAGACAALASATRSAGIVLIVPLLVLWWRSAPRRWHNLGWVALAPAGLALYSLYLALSLGDGFAYLHLQEVWFRSFGGPFGAIPDGARAAFDGVRQLASGSRDHVFFTAAGGDPFSVAWHNIELFGFLVFAVVATVGVLRRLPLAYGAYTLAALALPLSFPVGPQPLMSLPRFLGVLFPLFMWLAVVSEGERRRRFAMAVLALGL
ncbi:MAG: hypothetical protein QOC95_2163, partial [Thermoleophilaceae bacterium]|nr:hypothetical protein [Thermoleophilaceae bacterium]